ncbi:MAG: hypothetical protein M3Y84_01345, partial [Acidobacteriota bacterium]|nr:hypothetical protein [Acidobacteriota bacterium]
MTLNNATHEFLTASPTLYSLDGAAWPLPDISLAPNLNTALRLSELIAKSEDRGRFHEGSIVVSFNGEPMSLGAQLTVSDVQHGLSFDMGPPKPFKSSTLEGLWWSIDRKTKGQVVLCNTTNQGLGIQINLEWQGHVIPARVLSLSAHQTIVLEIEDLLKQLDIKAKGIESGGISISHSGAPGALIAHGVVQNKEAHFASNLRFIDPAAQNGSVLNGTGLMVAHPAAGAVFPNTFFFTPHLALKNASPSIQTATVTVQYTTGGEFHFQTLPVINLAPHEVRMVDFSALLSSLKDASVDDAGVKIESSSAPGSLIAQMTSIDQEGAMCIDVPLAAFPPGSIGTGAHPFHLDGDSQAVLHLKNLDTQPTTAIIQVLYDNGEFSPELVKLGSEESVAINLRHLRDSQGRDVHGHRLPSTLTQGQVQWFQHGKQSVIGRMVMSSVSLGVSANFSCGGVC